MPKIKGPVGPLPARVYWRRRLVLGLALVAVIVVIVLIIVKPGSSSQSPAVAETPAPTTAPVSSAPPAAQPAAEPQPCRSEQVAVEAVTDASDYAPGTQPQLSLTVTNRGTAPCTINAGTGAQVFTVTSGTDVYWTSTDCQTAPSDQQVVLEPGVTVNSSSPITWDRTRSAPETCEGAREEVPAGGASYYLTTSVDGIDSSEPKQFLLY